MAAAIIASASRENQGSFRLQRVLSFDVARAESASRVRLIRHDRAPHFSRPPHSFTRVLSLRAPRSARSAARATSAIAASNVCSRAGCGGRSLPATIRRALDRDAAARSAAHDLALARDDAGRGSRERRLAGRGRHAAAARRAPRRRAAGFRDLWIKDESANPTGSFKARGLSAAVSKAKELGVRAIALPTRRQRRRRAGGLRRAGRAWSATSSCREDTPRVVRRRVRALRREGHARRRPHQRLRPHRRARRGARGLVRRLDAQGALPRRGQEDDGLRAGRAVRLEAARRDPLPHRRRHGPDRHVEGVRGDGGARAGSAPTRPRMVAVQAEGCAPIPKAFAEGRGRAESLPNARDLRRRACACPRPFARLPDPRRTSASRAARPSP